MFVRRKENRESAKEELCVYSIILSENPDILVDHRHGLNTPTFVRLSEVDVLDPRISKFLLLRSPNSEKNNFERNAMLTFREWHDDPLFYEKLINGDDLSHKAWDKIRSKFLLEYAPPSVDKVATRHEGDWFECVHCGNHWQSPHDGELLICPDCGTKHRRISNDLSIPRVQKICSSS